MNRLRGAVNRLNGRKLLVPFFTAGFPSQKLSQELILSAVDAGADIIEIGLPFSDPIADGPAIQFSSQRALDLGVDLKSIIESVAILRRKTVVPIVLMGYLNPIIAFGPERFMRVVSEAGVDGLIIPDLPADEASSLRQLARANMIDLIFLVAPTSDQQRIQMIDRLSDSLIYAVTVAGVTGSRRTVSKQTETYLRNLKRTLSKPFVAGFGVSSGKTACQLARWSDGVVIGSALIEIVRSSSGGKQAVGRVSKLLSQIRRALNGLA